MRNASASDGAADDGANNAPANEVSRAGRYPGSLMATDPFSSPTMTIQRRRIVTPEQRVRHEARKKTLDKALEKPER